MSIAHARPAYPARQVRWTPISSHRWRFILIELVLLAGTLILAGIVKLHPGPLPGDLSFTLAWQHLIRPHRLIVECLDFFSLITWPTYVIIQMAAVVVVLALWRRWLDIALVLLSAGAADGSNFVISQFDRRPRPVGAGLYVHSHITQFFSFPSGHVEHVIAFLGVLVFLSFRVRRPHAWLWVIRIALIVMIALMGPARLLQGEHWPSDVLAGILWGGFWLILATQVYGWAANRWPRLVPANERKDPPPGEDDVPVTGQRAVQVTTPGDQSTRVLITTPAQGLSESEVRSRRRSGHGNTELPPTRRTYGQIVRHNFLTFINISLFGLGLALLALGRPMDALSAVGLICFNAVITAVQEIRTKRTLDRILVVTPPMVNVIREGEEHRIAPGELVAGDLVTVGPGDRIVVDGRIADGWLMVDEAPLSGKPQYLPKQAGDHLISGSTCISGNGTYVAERVGANSVIHRVASRVGRSHRGPTPLQKQINFVFSISLLAAIYIELLLVVRAIIVAAKLGDSVEQSAVIANLVPESVVLTIALAYAIGAIRVLRSGALAQEANVVDSLSNLSVLCLDKTGTLTSNRFRLTGMEPIGIDTNELRQIVADLAASSTTTKIADAIASAIPGRRREVELEIPFSSDTQWGAIAFGDPGGDGVPTLHGTYVFGAPDVLEPHLEYGAHESFSAHPTVDTWMEQHLMLLQVARVNAPASILDPDQHPQLPDGLIPIGLVALEEELRPETRAGLAALLEAGLEIKIISGDEPSSVARVARQAGIPTDRQPVSGHDLAAMGEIEVENAAETASIFGGVTAEQKEQLVEALRRRGHYVGMVGDGLNDVPALRRAHVGIAMQSGSDVVRDAADMILLNDSLSTLAPIMAEGQRIVSSLQPALKLFMTRIAATALVILSSLTVAEVFPLRLRHGTILTILTVAVPTVLLALWARPGSVNKDGPTRQLAHFVIPAALLSSMVGLLLFYGVLMLRVLPFISNRPHYTLAQLERVLSEDLPTAQTELAAFLVLTGLILVVFVAPPTKWWVGGSELSSDWRPTMMAVGLALGFGVLLEVPFFRALFGLAPLGIHHLAVVVGAAALWLVLVRAVWRIQLGERLLRLERKPGGWYRHAGREPVDSSDTGADIGWTTDTERPPAAVQWR